MICFSLLDRSKRFFYFCFRLLNLKLFSLCWLVILWVLYAIQAFLPKTLVLLRKIRCTPECQLPFMASIRYLMILFFYLRFSFVYFGSKRTNIMEFEYFYYLSKAFCNVDFFLLFWKRGSIFD